MDNHDDGALPLRDRATCASTEPASSLGHSAGIPSALHLAMRCEAAEGPDRELDVLIGLIVDWSTPAASVSLREYRNLCDDLEGVVSICLSHQSAFNQLPAYTASLDAALTLVPEGALIGLANAGVGGREPNFSRASAIVSGDWRDTETDPVEAATLPLALCGASLRAAKAIEAGTATTAGRGPKDESAGRQASPKE